MKKLSRDYGQAGSLVTIVAIIALAIGFVVAASYGVWANNGRQDYKNNSDKKSAVAVAQALTVQKATLQSQFDQQAKLPLQTFTGPATYGAVSFNYPKTWNGYVDETDSTSPIHGYFSVGVVPPPSSGVNYALRVELVGDDYTSVMNSYNSDIKAGRLTAIAYIPPKMVNIPNVQTGTRLDGRIESGPNGNGVQGSLVVLKVRDKTLKIFTESPSYLSDFNNTILASLTYIP